MAVAFRPGDQTGPSDLYIRTQNSAGNPMNAYSVSYSLYFVDQSGPSETEVLLPPADRTPENPQVGVYYASFQIPSGATVGSYRIRWNLQQLSNTPVNQVPMTFAVVSESTTVTPSPYSTATQKLIDDFRIVLRDNNPDRNYRFRPPEWEGDVGRYNQVFGYIWEDHELYTYLDLSLDWWNGFPPETTEINSIDKLLSQKKTWRAWVLQGAVFWAAQALQFNWVSEEFSYSIGGISLDIERSSKYDGLKSSAKDFFMDGTQQKMITVFHIRGLQQPRFGGGMSKLGPLLGRGVVNNPRSYVGLRG